MNWETDLDPMMEKVRSVMIEEMEDMDRSRK